MSPRSLFDGLISAICRLMGVGFRSLLRPRRAVLAPDARIAFLKPCCLGDVIMATAAVAAVRGGYPQAHLTFITGEWSREVLRHSLHLDETLTWDWSTAGRLSDLRRLIGLLRRGRYDAVLVLDRSPLLGVAAWLAGVPLRAGMDSGGRGFSLTHPAAAVAGRHEALLYLDVAAQLEVDINSPRLEVAIAPPDEAWAQARLPAGDWVAVHTGGGVNPGSTLTAKRWPVVRFAELAARLQGTGHQIVVVGGEGDAGLAGDTADAAPQGVALDLRGQTTLGQLAAVLARCRLFVGNDTGPMHLAVAVGTPVVAVFGPSKPAWYRPFSDRSRVVYHGAACAGCSFRGGLVQRCVNQYRCMDLATVDEVWDACTELLGREAEQTEGQTGRVPR